MTFEKIIGRISRILAVLVIFLIAANFYLSFKGFTWLDGELVLIRPAQAEEPSNANALAKRYEGLTVEAVTPSKFEVENVHILGDKNAPVTIYEMSSLGCSHCADFHLNILPQLKKDYIDQGKVKVIFADFPIDQKSMKAAMLARCMPEDKYFDFISLLFKKQMSWGLSFKTEKLLTGYAEMEGMSPEEAKNCMSNDKIASELMDIRQQAIEKLHINGTPSFLVRNAEREEVIPGAPSYDKLKSIINSYL